MFRMWRYIGALVLGGLAICGYGIKQVTLANSCKSTPSVLTGLELAEKGWGDNANVEVTKIATMKNYVYQTKNNSDRWEYAFVPMISLEGEYMKYYYKFYDDKANAGKEPEMPKEFCAIIKIKAANQSDVDRVLEMTSVPGVIINSIDKLDKEAVKLLRKSYPHVQLGSVAILEYNRPPESTAKGVFITAGGGAMMICGIMFLGWTWKNKD